jgi:hypothetical protein
MRLLILLAISLSLGGCAYNETYIFASEHARVTSLSLTSKPVSTEILPDLLEGSTNTVPISALP